MLIENFNIAAALAACVCPRCRAQGLLGTDSQALVDAPDADKHRARRSVDPSVLARCPACGLV